jgi:long-chain-fatty-acid--CoA ligase ACSBG
MGSILGGYLPIGIYTTNGPDACAYIAKHSECQVVVVENESHLEKYIKILDDVPLIKYFIIYDGKVPTNLPSQLQGRVFGWS